MFYAETEKVTCHYYSFLTIFCFINSKKNCIKSKKIINTETNLPFAIVYRPPASPPRQLNKFSQQVESVAHHARVQVFIDNYSFL